MMEWLSYWPVLLAALPWVTRIASVVRLLDMVGPFGGVVKVVFEFLANAISTVLGWMLRSVYRVTFEPATWGALVAVYLGGSFFPVQDLRVQVSKVKRERAAVVRTVKPEKKAVRNDAFSDFTRSFIPD
jgi:hypothetical protein